MADDVLERLSDEVIGAMRGFVVRSLGPLLSRIDILERRAPERGEKGEDGRSVDPAELSRHIKDAAAQAVEALPKPQNGKDANVQAIADDVLAKITKALDEIPAAKDGKDVDPEFVRSFVRDEVSRAVAALPPPATGKDARDFDPEFLKAEVERVIAAIPKPENGKDGKNADPEFTKQLIASMLPELTEKAIDELPDRMAEVILRMVKDAVSLVPVAKDGRDAPSLDELRPILDTEIERRMALVPNPRDGIDGRDAPALDELRAIIDVEVERRAALIPVPKDGHDADPEFMRQEVRRAVEALPKPEPGRDADPSVMRMQIVEELSRLPPPLPGKDADPETIRYEIAKQLSAIPKGNDGKDGFSLDDFDVELKDERNLVFSLKGGGIEKVKHVRLPIPIYREVYRSGQSYEKGDVVTYGGSAWFALKDTTDAPSSGTGAWRLGVKK